MPGRVCVSLPLTGPSGGAGRDVLRGAELELERAGGQVERVVLDAAGADRDEQAAANARRDAGLLASRPWRRGPSCTGRPSSG